MAGFKTHITTSTVIGVGYGAGGYLALGMPLETAMLATRMCSVAGMLPDLDSDTGVPLRESMAFAAAIVPMMLIDRWTHLGMSFDAMVLAGGLVYLFVRFGLASIIKKFTVHRGMFHSLPAAGIAVLIGFLVCGCEDMAARVYKACALGAGFMSHLLLDEIYSIEWYRGRLRLKSSFGTAVKLWGRTMKANLITYAGLIVLLAVAFGDPVLMAKVEKKIHDHGQHLHRTANDAIQTFR